MGKHRERMEQAMLLQGLASNTRHSNLTYARQFVKFCGRSADQLGPEDVHRWAVSLLREQKKQPQTVHVAIASARLLIAALGRPEVTDGMRYVRVRHRTLDVLSGSDVERLLRAAVTAKQHAIFVMLYGAGLRIAEWLALTPGDIDGRRMVVHVRITRNRRDRILPTSAPEPHGPRAAHLLFWAPAAVGPIPA